MFHLFKRFYLEHEESIDLRNNRIVLSPSKGFESPLNYYMNHGKVIYCTNYPNRIGPAEFVEILKNAEKDYGDEKILIYCDQKTYFKLVACWITNALSVVSNGGSVDKNECLSLLTKESDRYNRNVVKATSTILNKHEDVLSSKKHMVVDDAENGLASFISDRWAHVSVQYLVKKALGSDDELSKSVVTSLAHKFILRFYDELAFEYCEQLSVSYGTLRLSSHGKAVMDYIYNYNGHFFDKKGSIDSLGQNDRIEVINVLRYISSDIIGYSGTWLAQAFQYQNYVITPDTPFEFDDAIKYFDKVANATMLNTLFPSKDVENVDLEALRQMLLCYYA